MKFLVGYQLPSEDGFTFLNTIEPYFSHIGEVFFPWIDTPSGRSALGNSDGYIDWSAQEHMVKELSDIRKRGIRLDLLLNANCYGAEALSERFCNRILSIIDYLCSRTGGVDVVTTASPFVADSVKKHFPNTKVRASVNMSIGTVKAIEYLDDLFDSFYLQREYNRDLSRVRLLSDACKARGKELYMLANSGCLNFCTGHIFHDNLVAHEKEIRSTRNVCDFEPLTCIRHLSKAGNKHVFLQGSWIRPEDIHNYEGIVSGVKLATRTHARPAHIISAYTRGKFVGNLLDLCEPGYSSIFEPYIIDNTLMPEDFFKRVTECNKQCHTCDYCRNAFDKAFVKMCE
ncbi:MAG: hypothetical protein E7646_06465 [Ruminococcaceae bacterium]|nr:hypothetical protein [Oscillospiraceae bacterium]